jgi:uncharacterized membrane protein
MDLQDSVERWLSTRIPLIVTGIVLVGAFLRFYRLAYQSLWYDELVSMNMATSLTSLGSIWNARFYPHPPLFVALLHFLLKGLSPSEFSVRLLPACAGVLALPLSYGYLSEVANKRIALVALVLLTFSPFHIFYSQEGRPYALMFTMVIVTLWVFHRALRENGIGWWIAHALCILILLYLHFIDWCIVGSEILYMLLTWRRHRQSLMPFALSLSTSLLAIPPLWHMLQGSRGTGQVLQMSTAPSWISLPATWMTLIAGETRYVTQLTRLSGAFAFGLLALAGMARLWKRSTGFFVLALSILAVPTAFVFVFLRTIDYLVPPYEDKQFIIILPAALALAAAGVDYAWSAAKRSFETGGRVMAIVLLAILLGGNLVSLERYYLAFEKNADIRVIDYLESQVEPGDLIACNSFSMATNIGFHWKRDISVEFVAWPRNLDGQWLFTNELRPLSALPEGPPQWNVTLEDVLSHRRVWLVSQSGFDSPEATAYLLTLAPSSSTESFGPFSVYLLVP